ncbi:hypothetical protein C8Q80DRAFT_1148311 [Daedaleopsis nitida]|nr:hypothetical protein C8Q80DRAFT_1148311 [Daedaleopsis nitida]
MYSPLPRNYAVLQIDVEASLRDIDDPRAHAEARKIRTTKCIAYLCTLSRFPSRADPYSKFNIHLVGSGLRPADPARCVTPDMSIPIFPCTEHPLGRPPIHPNVPLPFTNCYHWGGLDMELRVRIKTRDYAEYESELVTSLAEKAHFEMDAFHCEDLNRSFQAMIAAQMEQPSEQDNEERQSHDGLQPDEGRLPATSAGGPAETEYEVKVDSPCVATSTYIENDVKRADYEYVVCEKKRSSGDWNDNSRWDTGSSFSYSEWNSEILSCSDSSTPNFRRSSYSQRAPDDKDFMLPVVDAWLDIGSQFPQEEIPDPLKFLKGYDSLVRILQQYAPNPSVGRIRGEEPNVEGAPMVSDDVLSGASKERLWQWTKSFLCLL